MTRDESERLQRPYTDEEKRDHERLARALGARAAAARDLTLAIAADLDADRYGIGWWAPHPGTIRRILISDYLYLSSDSISTNLLEAKFHLAEARSAAEDEERRWTSSVIIDPRGALRVRHPAPSCPADDLVELRRSAHVVACVRALASVLDCLAATVVGVLALPIGIFKAKYRVVVRDHLRRSVGDGLQARAARRLVDAIGAAGPAGWDNWVLAYRNMLVHRGRRMWMNQLVPAGAGIVAPGGETLFSPHVIPQLPNEPGRSDVEVLRDAGEEAFGLTENGWRTLEGAFHSTNDLVDTAAAILLETWRSRRSSPEALKQPGEQWSKAKPQEDDPGAFVGYMPGSVPANPRQLHANELLWKRLQAASLDDAHRHRWAAFDW